MKITDISLQARDKNRVNVSVDGKYRFSLDIFQVGELGLKVGHEYTDEELTALEDESQFGKLYVRAMEYCLTRRSGSGNAAFPEKSQPSDSRSAWQGT